MKQGTTVSLSFLIGIVITVMIVGVFVFFLAEFFAGADEQQIADAKEEFVNISKFYKRCVENSKDDCFCGSFSTTEFVELGYGLYLNKFLGQSNLLLTDSNAYPDSDGLISKDDIIEKASFDEELVCFAKYDGENIETVSQRVYGLIGQNINKPVNVLKIDSKLCVVFDLKSVLEKVKRDFASCSAVLDSDKLIMLDAESEGSSKQIATYLSGYLYDSVGRVDYFFADKYDDRAEWFDTVYDGDFLADKLFFIHIGTSFDTSPASEEITDKIIIHYVEGSVVGEAFAKAVGLELKSLKGKYYYDSVVEVDIANILEKSMFNTEVVYEANNLENPNTVYLVCETDELPICKENLQVPAIFIEIVNAEDGYSAYQNHEEILAKAIGVGVLNYVEAPAVYEYVPDTSDEPLFQ